MCGRVLGILRLGSGACSCSRVRVVVDGEGALHRLGEGPHLLRRGVERVRQEVPALENGTIGIVRKKP